MLHTIHTQCVGFVRTRPNRTTVLYNGADVDGVCGRLSWPTKFGIFLNRVGKVRELTRTSRSKFEMVWHRFSTVQFPSRQFVWKVRSVQFGAREPSDSVQFAQSSSFSSVHKLFRPCFELTWLARLGSGSVQSIESPTVWEEQRSISRSPPAEIPARRPGVCRLVAVEG